MCDPKPAQASAILTLHETVCRVTHGIPCKAAHGLGDAIRRLVGKPEAKKECCGGHAKPAAGKPGCGGHGDAAHSHACGCGGDKATTPD